MPSDLKISIPIVVVVATALAWVLSPGWLFWDSATQWGWAQALLDSPRLTDLAGLGISTQWPIVLTVAKAAFLAVTREIGIYAWLLAILFYLSGIFLMRSVLPGTATVVVATLLLVAVPTLWSYAVFHSSNVLTAIAFAFALATLLKQQGAASAPLLIAVLCLATAVQYVNIVPAAALFAAYLLMRVRERRSLLPAVVPTALAVALLTGPLLAAFQSSAHPVHTDRIGIAMRLRAMYSETQDPRIARVVTPLFEEGAIAVPLPDDCYRRGIWCPQVIHAFRWDADGSRLRRDYLKTLLRNPRAWMRINARMAAAVVGLSHALPETEVGRRDAPVPFPQAKMVFDPTREALLRIHRAGIEFAGGVLARPWLLASLAIVLLAPALGCLSAATFALFVGAFFLPYVLFAPAFGLRYQMPVIFPSIALIIAATLQLLRRWLRPPSSPSPARSAPPGWHEGQGPP